MNPILTNEIVDISDASYLIDYQGEGEMLAICFGFYNAGGDSQFDFYKRLKKLETLSGKKISKLLLRDLDNSWYLNGVRPLGDSVDETVAAIRKIIAEIKPGKIITIGQSMGGYGAILYGALLGVDKVISFGPLSTFDAAKLEVMRDYRWLGIARKIDAKKYIDLAEVIRVTSSTRFEIFYGTNPGAAADRGEAVNYDAAHALAFYGYNGVELFPFHNSPHAIVEYLRVNKVIDDLLLNRLFGLVPAAATGDVSAEWTKWLRENITLGCSDGQLRETLLKNNFTPESAAAALAHVHARFELEKIIT